MKHLEPSPSDVVRYLTEARSSIYCLRKLLDGDNRLCLEDWYSVTRSVDRAEELLSLVKQTLAPVYSERS